MRWFYGLGYGVGLGLGLVVTLVTMAVALVVVALHWFSFVLCGLGLHVVGCWIRRNMTTPVLLELRKLFAQLQEHARKKSGP